MGGRFDSSAELTILPSLPNFPGGIRGSAEQGHVRASEGIWIDDIIGILNSQKAQRIIKIPVGKSGDRRDRPVSSLPTISLVLPGPRIYQEDIITGTANGGRAIQNKGVLPVKIAAPPSILPTVRSSPAPEGVGLPTITSGGLAMPSVTEFLRDMLPGDSDIFDMGANILGMFGGNAGAAAPSGGGLPPPLPPPSNLPVAQSGGGMVPPNGGGGSCGTSDPAHQYVLKFSCGEWKWVKKRKRRRKRLATSSDVKDLSSLKGVLGGGKSFDLWIATHS